ncbi:MAG: NAD(P)/FAD-dependent oxidoreductase [Dehalococcoidia bacterium]|nr:MAG: NAD(P)/FAD-dependent oxidoreductase [Dehalococcoidia bacterium]
MTDRSIIIIGAGLAGLSTGCYAQMNGYRSHIFEHHSKPGGVAAAWKRKDFLIDGGIHFLMGHRPGQSIYDLYRELGTALEGCCTDMTTFGRLIDEVGGMDLHVTHDLDRLADDLKAIAPDDTKLIDDLIATARAMQGATASWSSGMAKTPELMNPLDYLNMLWANVREVGIWRTYKAFLGSYSRPVADYVRDVNSPLLRRVLVNLFLPEVPVWFVLMLLALLADRQIGLLAEGCPGFVRPIEERYKALGGEVTYRATVEVILVEKHRAVGVRLADGTEHLADVVVSAADGRSTIFDMLGGRYVDKKIQERYRSWPLIRPWVMASFGVAREFPDEPHFSLIMLKEPIPLGHKVINDLYLRVFNYSTKFAPPGKTVIQASFETEWDYWENLQKDRPAYDAEKQRVAEEVLARLEAHHPGLSPLVEVSDIATPYTTWRYTLNHRGAYEGWLPTAKNITTFIPRTLPGLSNFYMAGQWVMPGGGVPPCLFSGRHVVQILCKGDKKQFVTSIA